MLPKVFEVLAIIAVFAFMMQKKNYEKQLRDIRKNQADEIDGIENRDQ